MELKWISIFAILTIILSLQCELSFGDAGTDIVTAVPGKILYFLLILPCVCVFGVGAFFYYLCRYCVRSIRSERSKKHAGVESGPKPNDPASPPTETCTNFAKPLASDTQSVPATNYSTPLFLPPNYTEVFNN